ncbi:MAG: hypothetical protein ACLFMO_04810 [Eubacteriales bacterium]
MKHFYFVGLKDLNKIWFMCYLGKLLTIKGKVNLITDYKLWEEEIQPFELCSKLDYTRRIIKTDYEDYTFVLHDIEDYRELDVLDNATVIFMTSTQRQAVNYNKSLFYKIVIDLSEQVELNRYFIIYNIFLDSKINEKYIKYAYGEIMNSFDKHIIPFNEWDNMIHIENEYEEKIRLKYLSKQYKNVLNSILIKEEIIDKKKIKKTYNLVERG